MALFHTPYPEKCGIATLDAEDRVTDFVEKPDHPESDLANAGLYVLDAARLARDRRHGRLRFRLRCHPGLRGPDARVSRIPAITAISAPMKASPKPKPMRPALFGATPVRPAAFLDRDGTVIELVHHLTDPGDVRLIPGAGAAIAPTQRGGHRGGDRHQPVGDRPRQADRGRAGARCMPR